MLFNMRANYCTYCIKVSGFNIKCRIYITAIRAFCKNNHWLSQGWNILPTDLDVFCGVGYASAKVQNNLICSQNYIKACRNNCHNNSLKVVRDMSAVLTKYCSYRCDQQILLHTPLQLTKMERSFGLGL